jgi:hypothetical protein
MACLLQRIRQAREENIGSQLIIVSDANDFFIEAALAGLQPRIYPDKVITNTAVLPQADAKPGENNYLQIKPYETQTHCPICPINLCKGDALVAHIKAEGPFATVFYSGDGQVGGL